MSFTLLSLRRIWEIWYFFILLATTMLAGIINTITARPANEATP